MGSIICKHSGLEDVMKIAEGLLRNGYSVTVTPIKYDEREFDSAFIMCMSTYEIQYTKVIED